MVVYSIPYRNVINFLNKEKGLLPELIWQEKFPKLYIKGSSIKMRTEDLTLTIRDIELGLHHNISGRRLIG